MSKFSFTTNICGTFAILCTLSSAFLLANYSAPRANAADPAPEKQPSTAAVPLAPITGYLMKYRLGGGSENWPTDKRTRIVEAMNAAIGLYNQLGQFPKNVTAVYSPGTPTADGNYNGNIRFGGQIGTRVALHELGHVLGIGTYTNWDKFAKGGLWTGAHAIAQLRAFDGPEAVLHADGMHFWPYGLNYDNEGSPENFRRHVLMVAAFRRDMGITSGAPFKGRVGLGTWGTQAEFKDIKVVKGNQTLYQSDFTKGLGNWKTPRGQWEIVDGALRQTSTSANTAAFIGEPDWSDYTLTLKARKISGNEGFLIRFGAPDDTTNVWWNIGGWNNSRYGLEAPDLVANQVDGRIETGRWYDIRVELNDSNVKCYLDGKLVQEGNR